MFSAGSISQTGAELFGWDISFFCILINLVFLCTRGRISQRGFDFKMLTVHFVENVQNTKAVPKIQRREWHCCHQVQDQDQDQDGLRLVWWQREHVQTPWARIFYHCPLKMEDLTRQMRGDNWKTLYEFYLICVKFRRQLSKTNRERLEQRVYSVRGKTQIFPFLRFDLLD